MLGEGNIQEKQTPLIRPYSATELAKLYGMSARTIYKWLQPFKSLIGERVGWYYNKLQVEKIFELLGKP